jgi:site-specific DNA recombinase
MTVTGSTLPVSDRYLHRMKAVLYARLSISSDESVSIERQLQDGRAYCASQGWEVIGQHVDEGVSASANAPEHRKGWQEVLDRPAGSYDVVLVWKVDRLARKVIDFLHANETLNKRGAAVASVSDPIDMTTPTGRAFATMLAVFAEMEADATRERVKAARRALIKDGRVPGGAAPFGYYNAPNPDGPGKVLAKDPATIGVLVEASGRALRGDSINSIAAYLDEQAPRSGRASTAGQWTVTVTKRMLSNPILAGMTLHNPGNLGKTRGREVLRDEGGMPLVREDLAIMSAQELRQLTERLTSSPSTKATTDSYLSGLVWCGHCNRKMHRNAKTVNGKHVRVFQCQGRNGCGQQASHLERIVEEMFLARYGENAAYRVQSVLPDVNLTEIEAQIQETLDRMRESDADVMKLAERLKSLRATKARTPEPETQIVESGGTAAELWQEDRRKTLLFWLDRVELRKGKVGREFDRNRVRLVEPLSYTFENPEDLLRYINEDDYLPPGPGFKPNKPRMPTQQA